MLKLFKCKGQGREREECKQILSLIFSKAMVIIQESYQLKEGAFKAVEILTEGSSL